MHLDPLADGGGLSHALVLVLMQPLLHWPNEPHLPQFPFTITNLQVLIVKICAAPGASTNNILL